MLALFPSLNLDKHGNFKNYNSTSPNNSITLIDRNDIKAFINNYLDKIPWQLTHNENVELLFKPSVQLFLHQILMAKTHSNNINKSIQPFLEKILESYEQVVSSFKRSELENIHLNFSPIIVENLQNLKKSPLTMHDKANISVFLNKYQQNILQRFNQSFNIQYILLPLLNLFLFETYVRWFGTKYLFDINIPILTEDLSREYSKNINKLLVYKQNAKTLLEPLLLKYIENIKSNNSSYLNILFPLTQNSRGWCLDSEFLIVVFILALVIITTLIL